MTEPVRPVVAVTIAADSMTEPASAQDHDRQPRYSNRCGVIFKGRSPCDLPAGWGTGTPIGPCKHHGGATPGHRRRAQKIMAERAVETYGLPRDVPAELALLEEVGRTAGHVAWLAKKVAETDEADLVWGKTEAVEKGSGEFPGTDTKQAAVPNAFLELYIRERRHLLEVCKSVVGLSLEERRTRMTEHQVGQSVAVLRGTLAKLGYDIEDVRVLAAVSATVEELAEPARTAIGGTR